MLTSILFISIVAVSIYSWQKVFVNRLRVIVAKVSGSQRVLDPPSADIEVLLAARAQSRSARRLVEAFRINNAFTSSSLLVRNGLRNDAATVMRAAKMEDIKCAAAIAIGNWLDPEQRDKELPLDLLAQHITLSAVLYILFGVNIRDIELQDILFVSTGINKLWCDSKKRKMGEADAQLLDNINEKLHFWISKSCSPLLDKLCLENTSTPLNILLPAFETMWRVVAHTLVYVAGSDEYTQIMAQTFLNSDRFDKPCGDGLRACDIVSETLRLHPPTRRISRRIPFANLLLNWFAGGEEVAVDLVELHRDRSIWGDDGTDFNPRRQLCLGDKEKAAYIPFGCGPLKCVASSWAPRVIAVIAGAFAASGFIVEEGSGEGGREGWDGYTLRLADNPTTVYS